MKKNIFFIIIAFSTSIMAQEQIVLKECSVTMKQLDTDKGIDINMKVISKNDLISAIMSQTINGTNSSYSEVVEVQEESVRAGLSSLSDTDDLKLSEKLIVHAMIISEDPILGVEYSSGIDLKKVRSAKMYIIGKQTNMGSSTIVEARDEKNQVLGSFLGGFLISPCK